MLQNFFTVLLSQFLAFAPWLLLGLFCAGILHAFLPSELIGKWMNQKNGRLAPLWAALVGIPIPLCSCAVLPVAMGLRRQGASRGAVATFLLATPQTGVDSLMASWVMLGSFVTSCRPIVALIAGVLAGFATDNFAPDAPLAPTGEAPSCCCCAKEESVPKESQKEPILKRLLSGLFWANNTLLRDLALWLVIGLLISAAVETFVPHDFITHLGSHPLAYLAVLIIAIPTYVCSSASIPLASTLLATGVNPGVVVVFLLAGPATNISTFALMRKEIGMRATLVALTSMIALSILCGLCIDFIAKKIHWTAQSAQAVCHMEAASAPWWAKVCALVAGILLVWVFLKKIPFPRIGV